VSASISYALLLCGYCKFTVGIKWNAVLNNKTASQIYMSCFNVPYHPTYFLPYKKWYLSKYFPIDELYKAMAVVYFIIEQIKKI